MEETVDPREAARRALEGAEHTAKREHEEQAQMARAEFDDLNKKLATVRQQKEQFELAWIDLDGKKKAIRTRVAPLAAEEQKIEEEESKLETEEASTGVPSSRHEIELKRQKIQADRKTIEDKKWVEESKVVEIDKTIEQNTVEYRKLLDEEDKLTARLEELKAQGLLT